MTRIIISLPEELLVKLDTYCDEESYNRSECIRHAVRELLERSEEETELND